MTKLVLIFLLTAANLFAQDVSKELSMITGIWSGKLPCADCVSISYRLSLKSDLTYQDRLIYNGTISDPVKGVGTWQHTGEIIKLTSSLGSIQSYRIETNKLIMLDAEENPVPNSELTKLSRNAGEQEQPTDRWQERRFKGVDFMAIGNEPFWNVDINIDAKTISFGRLSENGTIEFTDITENKIMDTAGTSFNANTPKAEIKVEIMKSECTDNRSGDVFPYTVKVSLRTGRSNKWDEYTGCGQYLADYRLTDLWLIDKINGKSITEFNIFKNKVPMIEMNAVQQRFGGTAGCNSFNGSFEAAGSRIRFGKIASTLMMCPDMKLEQEFFDALNDKYFDFTIASNTLTLVSPEGKTVLELKKAD